MTRTEMKINGSVYNSTVLAKRAEDFIDSLPDGPLKEDMKGQTVTETLRDQLDLEIRKANKRIEDEDITTREGLDEIKRSLNPFIKAYNDSCRIDRLYALEKEPYASAMEMYMENQCVSGYVLAVDKESNEFGREDTNELYLKPYDVVRNLNPSAMPTIKDAAWMWLDNAIRLEVKDSESGINKPKLSSTFENLRRQWGWTGHSKMNLREHLAQIWAWMLGSVAPTADDIRTADSKFVIKAATNSKDVPNSPGIYEVCSEVEFINYVFRAAYTCKNGLLYEIKHKEKEPEKKTPGTIGRNKAMAEPAADKSKDATPKGGPVTSKKSTKKVDADPAHGSATLEPQADPKAPKAEPKK